MLVKTYGTDPREDENVAATALGRKGGKIGGKQRMKTMTAEQRRKAARKFRLAEASRVSASSPNAKELAAAAMRKPNGQTTRI